LTRIADPDKTILSWRQCSYPGSLCCSASNGVASRNGGLASGKSSGLRFCCPRLCRLEECCKCPGRNPWREGFCQMPRLSSAWRRRQEIAGGPGPQRQALILTAITATPTLKNPRAKVPGTKMIFPGLPKAKISTMSLRISSNSGPTAKSPDRRCRIDAGRTRPSVARAGHL
jgi:hypothetical protein